MRFAAVLTLVLLAPFTGELLLGNLPADPAGWAVMLIPLILLYGGGALLIREVARRLGRGYPTMLLLAIAYGLIEEGFVIGTLFNPDYLGLSLLDHGWVPALGTSPIWSIYVVGIHSVWSILVPIVLTEHLFPARARTTWLGIPGLVLALLVYLVGATAIAAGVYVEHRFFPAVPQLLGVAVLALAAVVIAFSLQGRSRPRARPVPAPGMIASYTFLGGSAFVGLQMVTMPPVLTVALMLAVIIVVAVLVGRAATARAWSPSHAIAAAAGAVVTYCWTGFVIQLDLYGATALAIVSQSVFVIVAGLVLIAARRGARLLGRSDRQVAPDALRPARPA